MTTPIKTIDNGKIYQELNSEIFEASTPENIESIKLKYILFDYCIYIIFLTFVLFLLEIVWVNCSIERESKESNLKNRN
jgi:hypothetical protein